MSGHKVAQIRISQAEYARLREAEEAMRLNTLQHGRQNAAASGLSEAWGTIQREQVNRNHVFDQILSGMDVEIRSIEHQAGVALRGHVSEIESRFRENEKQFSSQLTSQVDQWLKAAEDRMNRHLSALEQYWQAENSRQIVEQSRRETDCIQAQKWLQASQEMLAQFEAIYPNLQRFESELSNLQVHLQQVSFLLQAERFDMAYLSAFQLFVNITQTRHRLENDLAVSKALHQQVWDEITQLLEQILSHPYICAMDLDGNLLEDEIDVDFWSGGQLSALVNQISDLAQSIQDRSYIPAEELRPLLEKKVKELESDYIDLVTRARLEALSSQLRFNIGQIALQALESQGFFVQNASYDMDDFRNSYRATTCNSSGNEVVITIDPSPSIEQGGQLSIDSLDASEITEHELLQRNREIFTAIREQGLEVSLISSERLPQGEGSTPVVPVGRTELKDSTFSKRSVR